MSDWDYCKRTTPTARKTYPCDASVWLQESLAGVVTEEDFSVEDWATIEKARAEGFKILPKMRYIRLHGKWEGEWATFVAREDIDDICKRYGLYEV